MSPDRVVGVDIVRAGGDLSQFAYALVAIEDGSLRTVKEVSFGGLIRELWDLRPAVLATDNILELGGSKKNLMRMLKLLPPDINVVLVNVEAGRSLDLHALAEEVGLTSGKGKLDPFKTALVVAYLAREGYGQKVNIFENKVKIYVYPGRSGVAGGSRTEKFLRNLHGAVSRHVKKIKEALNKSGVDYDLLVRRSSGGIARAVFIAYTTRENLQGVVKPARGRDVVVRIKPVLSKKFLSDLLKDVSDEGKRYLIAGYDPGMNVGLAVIDLDMNPVYITSGRELDRGEVSSILIKLGHPAVIATDKNPPPEMCRKLAASLGALLYVPQRSLSTAEKELMVAEFTDLHPSTSVKNAHERDALAAAIKAYSEFQEKIEKLSRRLKEMGLYEVDMQKYRVKVLMNETLSTIVEEIINEYVGDESRKDNVPIARQDTLPQVSKAEETLRERLSSLEREKELYRQRILELEGVIRKLTSRLETVSTELSEKILKDRKVSELAQRVKSLEAHLRALESENSLIRSRLINYENAVMKLYAGTHVLIPIYSQKCSKLSRAEGVKTLVVFTYDITETLKEVQRMVEDGNVALVLPPTALDLSRQLIEESLVPAVASEDVVEVNQCLVAVDRDSVNRAIALAPQLAEERRKKVSGLSYEDLVHLVEEYRRSRDLSPVD
ncbi:MAG: DUF460 domain-containing protein [Zestosphaera sp.]